MNENETTNPAIPDDIDEMRRLLLEAEESKFWMEEPGEEGEEPRMPFPLFGMGGFPEIPVDPMDDEG